MYGLLITLSIIVSVLLVVVILLQSSKGTGLAGTFGGGGGAGGFGTMFGSRRTADFLSKSTWWLGGALMVIAIVINLFFLPGQSTSEQRESIIQGARSGQAVPTAPALPQQQAPAENNAQPSSGK